MRYDQITAVVLSLVLVMLVINYFQIQSVQKTLKGTGLATVGNTDTVKGAVPVEFYVMSQCPYGIQVENAIAPALGLLGDAVDFRVDYIADGSGGRFTSLHGQPEVEGDKIQLCVQEHFPQEFMDFVTCQNQQPANLGGTVESCSRAAGIDSQNVLACASGEEGNMLLEQSIAASRNAGATGSPTMFVNNKPYRGERSSQAFLAAICNELAVKPAACNSIVGGEAAAVQGGCE
ncbi:MAG TPA: hypothetical protein VJB08_01150 [Candidatus Nanoarchaeia archaeon]|nr:hypothetical protein [Candidatus Nanoarchaeia archaeon]